MSTITGKLTRSAVTGRVASIGSMICTPSARRDLEDEIVLPESFIEPLATDGTFSLELDDTDGNWWWTLTEDVPRGRTRYVAVDGDSPYSDLEDVDPSSGVVVPPLPPVWRSYIDAAIAVVSNALNALAVRVTAVEGTLTGRLSDGSITAKITEVGDPRYLPGDETGIADGQVPIWSESEGKFLPGDAADPAVAERLDEVIDGSTVLPYISGQGALDTSAAGFAPSAFAGTLVPNVVVPDSTWTVIAFGPGTVNTDGYNDTATRSIFTLPFDGRYRIRTQIQFPANAVGRRIVTVTLIAGETEYGRGLIPTCPSDSPMNVGAEVLPSPHTSSFAFHVRVWQNSGAPMTLAQNLSSWLYIERIA